MKSVLSQVAKADALFDAGGYCYGDRLIERHMHRYTKAVPETRERQRRMSRKWRLNRERLHRRTTWSQDLMQEWQLETVSTLVDFAFNTIPFYRKRYGQEGFRTGDIVTWNDFNCLPTISRSDLQEDFPEAHVLAGVDPAKCYGARTSGSSGSPLTLVRDDAFEELATMRRMRQFELMLGSRLQPTEWSYNIYLGTWAFTSFDGEYPVFSISEDCPPEAILGHISRLRPRIISAFPSFLHRLSVYAGDLSQHGVGCICTNSETSTRQERHDFAAQFGVPVLDEYSTEELRIVASECRYGRYHVLEDAVRVDVANVGTDGLGDIIGTSLANFYMPIIRYRQGDLIGWGEGDQECECGNKFRYLRHFIGREDQALVSASIGRVPPDRVMNLCDRTLVSYSSGIGAFRVTQKALDRIEVELVLRRGEPVVNEEILHSFCSGLRELFENDIAIEVLYRDTLSALRSHKRRMIINELR